MRHWLVCYDICAPGRLKRVHRILRDFGAAIQYSVFACRLSDMDRAVLEARLLDVLDVREDQVMFVDLGRVGDGDRRVPGSRVLGKPRRPELAGAIVL